MREIVRLRVVCCSCNHEVPDGVQACPRCGNRPGRGYFLYLNSREMETHFPGIEMAKPREG